MTSWSDSPRPRHAAPRLRLTNRGAAVLLALVVLALLAAALIGQHREQTWCEQHTCSTTAGVAWKHVEAGVAWKGVTP